MEVPLKNPRKSLLELLISKCIAEGVHRAIGITQKVREHKQMFISTRRVRAKPLDQSQHMVRSPTSNKRPQNKRNRPERLPSPILRPTFRPAQLQFLPLSFIAKMFAQSTNKTPLRQTLPLLQLGNLIDRRCPLSRLVVSTSGR